MTGEHLNAGIGTNGKHVLDDALHNTAVYLVLGEILPSGKVIEPRAIEQNARCVDGQIALNCADNLRRATGCDAEAAALADKGFNGETVCVGDVLVVVIQRSVQIGIKILAFKGAHVASRIRKAARETGGTIAFILTERGRKRNLFQHLCGNFTRIGRNPDVRQAVRARRTA
jgi:hypothetical protein